MGLFFTRSRCRKALCAGGSILAAVLLFSFTVDLWIQRKLPFIETAVSDAMDRPVEIRRAGYSVFEGFTLDDLTVKEIKSTPMPFTIRRVRAIPSFRLFPKPKILIHRVIFVEPRLSLSGKPEELFRAGSLVRLLPSYRSKIGHVELEAKLSAFLIERGRVIVFAGDPGNTVKQEFERISFFAGSRWMHKNSMQLRGRIAGKPDARFRLESDIFRESPGSLDSNVRIDLNEFTTSYLAPYLKKRFKMPDKNLTASLRLKIRGRQVESDGQLDLVAIGLDDRLLQYLTRRSPRVRYYVSGSWNKDTATFTKVHVKTRKVRLSGRAELDLSEGRESYHLSLISPEISLDHFRGLLHPWKLGDGKTQISVEGKGSPLLFDHKITFALKDGSLFNAAKGAQLDHIDGKIRLTSSGAEFDELWLFANNLPLRLSGRMKLWDENRFLALEASTYPGQIPSLKPDNPFNALVKVRAVENGNGWRGYARGMWDEYSDGKPSTTSATLSFKDLSPDLGRCEWLSIRSLGAEGAPFLRSLAAKNVRFAWRPGRGRMRVDVLEATLQNGKLRGTLWADPKERRWKMRADIDGADYRNLAKKFSLYFPADGDLTLRAHAGGGPKQKNFLWMGFRLKDGFVGPGPSLASWASQTGIDSLRFLHFSSFKGTARWSEGLWQLEGLELDSDDAKLTADLKIREERVNGKLSVRFSAASIRPKSDLAWLMDFAKQSDWVDFDFHVAGFLTEPRIEWLAGEFKKKIETRLSPWMRSELARRIEQRFAV